MFPKFRTWVDTCTGFESDENWKFKQIRKQFMEYNFSVIKFKDRSAYQNYNEIIGDKGLWFDFDDAIFMRSTGKKDKNGNEIYEKDIVKDNKGQRYIIEFISTDNFCGFKMIPIKDRVNPFTESPSWKSENIEVIGNAFENDEYKYYRKGGYAKRRFKRMVS